MAGGGAKRAARRAGGSEVVGAAARLGYAVNGLMHLLIAWIALQLAWGGAAQQADQSGALATLSSTGPGAVLLMTAVFGFAGLALWQLTDAFGGRSDVPARAKAAGKGVVYVALAWTALSFARGGSSSSEQRTNDVTTTLMGSPAGPMLVGGIALGILGVAVYHVVKGWTRRFLRDLRSDPGRAVVALARFGYIAKGVALGVVAALFGLAALRHDPEQAGGLDQALRTLQVAPLGTMLLTVIALGLAAYGIYSFARSRHADV